MKIRFILSVFVVIAAAFLVIAAPVSAQVINGDDDIIVTAEVANSGDEGASEITSASSDLTGSVTNGDDEGASEITSASSDLTGSVTNGDDEGAITPAVDFNTTVGEVTNGDDDAAGIAPVETPIKTSSSVRSSGGSSSGSSSRSSISIASILTQLGTTTGPCPLITASILKLNGSNDSVNVSNLQFFLKNIEKIDVDVTGIFDVKTESAVSEFQIKYKDSVLAPWDATKPSGIAYITTIKKINEISCKQIMTLSTSDLAIIAAYNSNSATSSSGITPITDSEGNIIGISTSTDADQTNVAGVADASILKRLWNFITGIFR